MDRNYLENVLKNIKVLCPNSYFLKQNLGGGSGGRNDGNDPLPSSTWFLCSQLGKSLWSSVWETLCNGMYTGQGDKKLGL